MTRSATHRAAILLALAFTLLVGFGTSLVGPIADGFHEGEILANRLYFQTPAPLPVMIHGMMDVIPATLGSAMFGEACTAVGARTINALSGTLALLFLFVALFRLGSGKPWFLPALVLAMALLFLANRHAFMQQGAPAVRELFLNACAALLALAAGKAPRRHDLLLGCAAFIAGATLFWAYNRGVAALALVGTYALFVAVTERSARALFVAGVTGAVGLAINLAWSPALFRAHLASMAYWQEHQSIWHLSTRELLPWTTAIACAGLLLGAGLIALWRGRSGGRPGALVAACAVAGSLVLASSLNRLDMIHAWMIVPYALLAGFGLLALADQGGARQAPAPATFSPELMLAAAGLIVAAQLWTARHAIADNAAAMIGGLPTDRHLADPAYVRVADRLRASGTRCTLAFDNQSIVNHLSAIPPCSAFLVPIYAQGAGERRMLADLQGARPDMIVLRSGSVYFRLDDRPQPERTPLLARWLAASYVPVAEIDGFVLARRRPSAP